MCMVKCVAELLGIKSAMEKWGIDIKPVIKSDAFAALGIIQRHVGGICAKAFLFIAAEQPGKPIMTCIKRQANA